MTINADARLLPLADESVHCVVTSPPYWGLRNYGTAEWVGGDDACVHTISQADADGKAIFDERVYRGDRSMCLRCGALRVDRQLGLEAVPDCLGWATGSACGECYVCHTVQWAREVWRVLRDDGTFWLNIGDTFYSDLAKGGSGTANGRNGCGENYARGLLKNKNNLDWLKPKDLVGIPWAVAFALRADGWYLRLDHIWAKGVSGQKNIWNQAYDAALREGIGEAQARRIADAIDPYVGNNMPESATDRCTKSHEYVFMFAKSPRYFFDHWAIREKQTESSRERSRYGWHGRIDDKSNGARTGSSFKRMAESVDDNSTIPKDGLRNRRSVWAVPTKSYTGEHFAAYPPKLIEPCILAGTSEKGCCPKCGAPWKRILQRTKKKAQSHHNSRLDAGKTVEHEGGERTQTGERHEVQDAGWQPTCACGESETVPCTVLDPFSGTGTTGEVCAKHGRNYIGIELNPKYITLQKRRVGAALFKSNEIKKQSELF